MADSSTRVTKRRVPEALRRRTLVSCDRCKTRRIRCLRSNDEQSCTSCLEGGFTCESTIPRRKRLYGSVESLSTRFKALESLVKGLFPNDNVENVQSLLRLAAERGIDMSAATDSSLAADAFHSSPTSQAQASGSNSSQSVQWPCNIDQTVQGAVVSLPEENCIPAPHGVAHYIGPSSSFEFANAIRSLVNKRTKHDDATSGGQDRRSRLRADFASLKTSIALEPRIQEHPASTVREEGVNPDDDESLSAQNTPVQTRSNGTAATEHRSDSPYRKWLRDLMPTKSRSDDLVQAFFTDVHPNYVLFHRGTFQSRYDSIWHGTRAYAYDAEPGWLCCLFMTLVFGAQASESKGCGDAILLQRRFLRFVRERFQQLALTASLANVQALLLLQLYEHNAGERNTAWILLGQAARMAVALGMHREGTGHHFDTIERNTRRMVWFTLYSFEQYSSLVLGRPSTVKALEVNIRLPDETIVDGNDYPPGYLHHASLLMDLTSKVRHFSTAASPSCFDAPFLATLTDSAMALIEELHRWESHLPRHLRTDWDFMTPRHLRTVFMLHVMYQHVKSNITRPYLLCKVDQDLELMSTAISNPQQIQPSSISALAEDCLSSAQAVAGILQELASNSLLEGILWTDFFYLYHAILVISLGSLGRSGSLSNLDDTLTQSEPGKLVSFMVDACQTHRLSPTYQILSQVAVQFAYIVGFSGPNSVSRDEPAAERSDGPQPPIVLENTGRIGSITDVSNGRHSQSDNFMPYVEPISDIYQFNQGDALWDFFNISNTDGTHATFNPHMQAQPSLSDFHATGSSTASDRFGAWHF